MAVDAAVAAPRLTVAESENRGQHHWPPCAGGDQPERVSARGGWGCGPRAAPPRPNPAICTEGEE